MNRKARVMETWDQRTPDAPPFKVPNVKAVEICGFERGLNDRHHSYSLFVQFPYGIKDKLEAKLLHPGIEAVKLSPETKRWCYVTFRSKELAQSALKELNKKKVRGGKLLVIKLKKFEQSNKRTPELHKRALTGSKTQDKMEANMYEATETSGDDDFLLYRAIELEDERCNDDDFAQYSAIKLEDVIELEGTSTKTSGVGGGDDDDNENDNFLQYRTIELEDDISETGEDDISCYKPIELEY